MESESGETAEPMRFNVGDKVVYPNQGIAVVETIEDLSEELPSCYRLRLLQKSTTVHVPVMKVESVGLRPIMTDAQTEAVFDVLENFEVNEGLNWKARYKENSDRMKSGLPIEVAQVLKGLFFLSMRKTLSFREKRMLDRAHELTITELAQVAEQPPEDVEQKVMEVLHRSRNGGEPVEDTSSPATSVTPSRPIKRRRTKWSGRGRGRPVSISIQRY